MRFLISLCASLLLLLINGSTTSSSDPCYNYTILDEYWRDIANYYYSSGNDSLVEWRGWYRLYLGGLSAQMSEWCVSTTHCGGETGLSLSGSHPRLQDGVVTREVVGTNDWVWMWSSSSCGSYKSNSIRVKACPGDYYVYELVKPNTSIPRPMYCADISTISQPISTISPAITTRTNNTLNYDPCINYNTLNDSWRNILSYGYIYGSSAKYDDTGVNWDGWYRLFLNGLSAQMPEWCVSYLTCGGFSSLWLAGSHPRLEDGVVTRDIYGSYFEQCSYYRSDPIQVKACPGNYYVYKFTRPDLSIPSPAYCSVRFTTPSVDPCYNYNSLDETWRATNNSYNSSNIRRDYFQGWYRLFYNGQSAQMPESCVNQYMCGTYYPMWINGSHPRLEDGVVTRQVCGSGWSGCCTYKSLPIQVKACPGNYYVYEFVRPVFLGAYCADVTRLSAASSTTAATPTAFITPTVTSTGSTTSSSDPCYNYTILDEYWRDIQANYYYSSGNDSLVEWRGWYRLYLRGLSAQMSEWCVSTTQCGGETGLSLNGSHPRLEDGVVTRDVVGTNAWVWMWSSSSCGSYKSNSIRVKACPGDYYVYELVKPNASIPRPMYCAVAFQNISSDPCYNYKSLDRPWRANNESGTYICDYSFSWNGWYRFFYRGMNIQLPETCVSIYRCNTQVPLWLNGPHPRTEDGVVIREVCGGTYGTQCCDYKTRPIRVKACPGNYYVYELVRPNSWCAGYCTNISTISQPISTISPAITTRTNNTLNYDPCINYNTLNDSWRNIRSYGYIYGSSAKYDDTGVNWDGWYRLFLNGLSAQMPEWCVSYLTCGGFSSLWLAGSHPRLEDGVVTRDIYGSYFEQCSYYRSDPIQVKACPGNYYVYKFTRPDLSIPSPAYCSVRFTTPSVDPCYNYNSLDETWRATNYSYNSSNIRCDYSQGWYRLFYNGQSAQIPESCVNQYMCGTYIPMWLNGSHPRLEDGVVTRQVCGSGWSGCCTYRSFPIQVKACPGNYYVYEFVSPVFCGAYCADVTRLSAASSTTAATPTAFITPTVITTGVRDHCSELSCSEDEHCGEKNGVYGCLCNTNHSRWHSESFDFSETCESSSGSMSVSRCQLFEAGFSADILHLNDPSCKGTVRNGRVEFHFDNNEHICGTNLVANGTHFIYDNFILGTPRTEGLISREKILKLSFSCAYPQTQTLSMNVEINPLESIVHKSLPAGEGRYRVRMIPYQDNEFTRPFTGSLDAELNQEMHVEVRVEGVDSRQFALVIDTCWATPVKDPDYSLRWDLIVQECPNPNDDTVELLQNGVSTSSGFSFRMFIFTANSTKLYLHCAVQLCLLSSNHCSVNCNSGQHWRKRRSLDFHDSSSISMGPLMLSEGNTDKWVKDKVKVSKASSLCASLMVLFVFMMSFLILF
uniref:ZP domain-containing protein n=1 Tax=Cyprinus carpio carpio TaxID=630221 RepID=A0A9J7Z173_CYPCA